MTRYVPMLTAATLVFLTTGAHGKIYIDITEVSDRSFPMAIVPLARNGGESDPTQIGSQFSDVLRGDLGLMGVFRLIDEKAFLEEPTKLAYRESNIDFSKWAVLDALGLVKGWYKLDGKRITIEAHLFDVLLKKELSAKKYEGPISEIPWMAHRFANEVMRILTGEPGLFDTKISFIGSPEGKKELFAMDFNGDNVKRLTTDRSIVLSPAWKSDASAIYYTSFKNARVPQLYRYDLRRDQASRVTTLPGLVIGISLDPQGDGLATTLTKDGNSEIYMLGLDGMILRRLTRNADIDVSASFSPDGKQMVFVSDRDGSAQIYKMDRDGQSVQRLSFKGRNNTAPKWSPKGDKIAFAGMDDDGHFDIFTMNTDGTGMIRLTYDTRNNEEPSWSPDGQMIAFSSDRTRKYQIYTMRPDGSHQAQLTREAWNHYMPAWGPKPK